MSSSRFYTSYKHVLPNELDVIKFTDSYYNNKSQFTVQINDMGRTINAISYLTSEWFCSVSKLVKSNILDARGCWQIKARPDPVCNKYTVTVEYKLVDGKIKYSIYNSACEDKTISPDIWQYFNSIVIRFMKYINGTVGMGLQSHASGGTPVLRNSRPFVPFWLASPEKKGGLELSVDGTMDGTMNNIMDILITHISISYQMKMYAGKWHYIIDTIMMPDDFTINKLFTGTDTDKYCFFNAENINITEVEINDCYNRLFKVLEKCPGFINKLVSNAPDMQVTKRILYNAKTIEQYITDANTESNGRYY